MSNVELLPEQSFFMESKKPIICYVGGLGAGKSYVACIKAVRNALRGRTQLLIGLTYSSARDVLFDTLGKVLDMFSLIENVHYKINKSQLDIRFANGYKIMIRSAEIGNKLRGLNVADIYIDEAAYLKDDEVFKILLGRMREVSDGQMHLTTSPRGFNWVYELTQGKDCELISVSTFKNPFLSKRYIKTMIAQYTTAFIQQELYAQFINISSGIFNSKWIKDSSSDPMLQNEYHTAKKIRFWDFAFSEDGDFSAGVLMAKIGHKYVVEDIVRVQQNYTDLRKTILNTAKKDGNNVQIGFEHVGAQKAIINDLVSLPELSGFIKKPLKIAKYGHKIKRILPLSSLAENGSFYITKKCKHKTEFFSECDALTMDDSHANDDMVDAAASAYILFNNNKQTTFGHRGHV